MQDSFLRKKLSRGETSSFYKTGLGRETWCSLGDVSPGPRMLRRGSGGRCYHLSRRSLLPRVGARTKNMNSEDPFKSTNLRVRRARTLRLTVLQPALQPPPPPHPPPPHSAISVRPGKGLNPRAGTHCATGACDPGTGFDRGRREGARNG